MKKECVSFSFAATRTVDTDGETEACSIQGSISDRSYICYCPILDGKEKICSHRKLCCREDNHAEVFVLGC